MLTVRRCKELLGSAGASQTDEEIRALRDALYTVATATIEMHVARQKAATESRSSHAGIIRDDCERKIRVAKFGRVRQMFSSDHHQSAYSSKSPQE